CDGASIPEIARAMKITPTQAENAYKHARKRLASELEELVREHVRRYCPAEEIEDEFAAEWGRLGEFLKAHGGLEDAVRRANQGALGAVQKTQRAAAMNVVLASVKGSTES